MGRCMGQVPGLAGHGLHGSAPRLADERTGEHLPVQDGVLRDVERHVGGHRAGGPVLPALTRGQAGADRGRGCDRPREGGGGLTDQPPPTLP